MLLLHGCTKINAETKIIEMTFPFRRQSVLIIRKAKDVDKGVYKCEAKNVFGSAHAITRVITSPTSPKPEKPPSPKTVGK